MGIMSTQLSPLLPKRPRLSLAENVAGTLDITFDKSQNS